MAAAPPRPPDLHTLFVSPHIRIIPDPFCRRQNEKGDVGIMEMKGMIQMRNDSSLVPIISVISYHLPISFYANSLSSPRDLIVVLPVAICKHMVRTIMPPVSSAVIEMLLFHSILRSTT